MVGIDFDFARYVAERKGEVHKRARDGAAYAYLGERKFRRTLASARPVAMAIEATTRLWKNRARKELLERAVKATDRDYPSVNDATERAGKALGIEPPAVYVLDGDFPVATAVLGTDEDPVIVLRKDLVEALSDKELVAILGQQLGHVQNNHVLLATALFYLRHDAVFFVRWIVKPAVLALSSWSRRADITCDRAALIAARDLDLTVAAMVHANQGEHEGVDPKKILEQLGEARNSVTKVADIFRDHPHLTKRAKAVELFAATTLYRRLTGEEDVSGPSADDVDAEVAALLKVFA